MRLIVRQCKWCGRKGNCGEQVLFRESARLTPNYFTAITNCKVYFNQFKAGDKVEISINDEVLKHYDPWSGPDLVWQFKGNYQGTINGFENGVYHCEENEETGELKTIFIADGTWLLNGKAQISKKKFFVIKLNEPIEVYRKGEPIKTQYFLKLPKDIKLIEKLNEP